MGASPRLRDPRLRQRGSARVGGLDRVEDGDPVVAGYRGLAPAAHGLEEVERPRATRSATSGVVGKNLRTCPTARTAPLLRAVSTTRRASAAVVASGFSQRTWTPASSRRVASSAWRWLGAATTAASTAAGSIS